MAAPRSKLPDYRAGAAEMVARLQAMTGYRVDTSRAIAPETTFRQWCEELAKGTKPDGSDGLKVDGRPFSLVDRPALIPLYDAIPTTREEAKGLILVVQKATQLGLTIWEVLASIYMALKWEPVSIGMFMPAQATAIHKSEHRFMRIVRSAPPLYKHLTTGRDIDGRDKKVGEGNVLTRRVGDSLLLFLWTSGKVTTESVPMDVVTLDEVQEITLDQIDKVFARMGDSDIGFAILLSTANNPDLDINFWYQQGNQEVWHSECPHCSALSDLSDPAGIFPDKSIGYDSDAQEYYWKCPECGGRIDNPQHGRPVITNPGASPRIRSFLLPRTISPRMTPRDMIERWGRIKTADQRKSFYNRTLARPYIDADQLPVTMAHCEAAAAEGVRMGLKWETSGRDTFCGIDQMGGFNAVIVKRRLPDGRQAVVHVEAVFGLDPFARCSEILDQYGVMCCVLEQLPNVNDARRFANKHRGRVFLAGYADLRDDAMVWGDDMSRSDRKTSEDERSRYTVTLNQYKCMQTALYRVRGQVVDGKMVPMCLFPDPDGLEQDVVENGRTKRVMLARDWVFVHFTKTALVIEQDEEQRKPKAKVHKIGIDPHFSYANMLCDVAWARSHGTSMFILPEGPEVAAENKRNEILSQAVVDLPAPVVEMMVHQVPEGRCGRCSGYADGFCSVNEIAVRAEEIACEFFDGD